MKFTKLKTFFLNLLFLMLKKKSLPLVDSFLSFLHALKSNKKEETQLMQRKKKKIVQYF